MANKTRSELKAGAVLIRDETGEGQNTAPRVGGQHVDQVNAGLFEYDPNDTYQPGEYCIYKGGLAKAKTIIGKGESPESAVVKWDWRVAKTADDIVLGNFNPVSTNAVAELLARPGTPGADVPNATKTTRGKVRFSTDAEYDAGLADDLAPTVKQVHQQLQDLGLDADSLTPTLDELAQATPQLKQNNGDADRIAAVTDGLIRALDWDRAANYLVNTMAEGDVAGLMTRLVTYLSIDRLLAKDPVRINPFLVEGANLLFERRPGNLIGAGIYVSRDGTSFPDSARFETDRFLIGLDNAIRLLIDASQVQLTGPAINLNGPTRADSLSVRSATIAEQPPTYLPVGIRRTDGTTGIEFIPFAPFQAVLNAQSVTYGQVKQVYCESIPVPTPTQTGWRRLTPASLGTSLTHPLETAGSNIIVSMRGSDNRPEDILDYDFPDADHIRFRLPAGITDWAGGSYKLETIQS